MKNRKIIALIMAVFMAFGVFACGETAEEVVIPEGYTRIDISQTANKDNFAGMGAQFDAHFWQPPMPHSEEDWAIWMSYLRELRLDHVRLKIVCDWFEPENDNDDPNTAGNFAWDTAHMKGVYRVLDACQELGIHVNLSWYGASINLKWLAVDYTEGTGPSAPKSWVSKPKDYNEFAENVYEGLSYLRVEKKYTCIDEISIYPEPELNFFNVDQMYEEDEFYKLTRIVHERLVKEGIRDKVIFSGPAMVANSTADVQRYCDAVGDIVDKISVSWYRRNVPDAFSENGQSLMELDASLFVELVSEYGLPIGTSEFNSLDFMTTKETYEHGLYIAKTGIVALKNGFSALSFWMLGSIYYDNALIDEGLWRYKTENWSTRPVYHTYGLLSKYAEYGSEIFVSDCDVQSLEVLALKSPAGKWTYAIINTGTETRDISIVNGNSAAPSSLEKYEVTRTSMPSTGIMTQSAYTYKDIKAGTVSLKVKPESMVILSNLED